MPGAPYDTVLANPPFGQTLTKQQREDHKRALADGAATYPLMTTPTGLFLQRIVRVLAVGGRACVVLPLGRELSSRAPADVLFRRALLHAVALREVVVIPNGQFECTSVRTAAIVFDKVRELGDCVIAGARGAVTLNPDVPSATESFRFVTVVDGATPTSAPFPGVRAVVTAADVAAAAWSLSPDDYKTAQADVPPVGLYPHVRLGDICTLSPGTSFSKASIVPGDYPVVGGGVKPMGMHNTHNTAADVTIISATGAAGSVSKYNTPTYCTADALRLTTNGNVNGKFIHYCLSTVAANTLTQMRTGMAQPHFNKRAFAELTIPLPPVETQHAIAAELDRQSQAIAQIESAIQSLEGAKLVVLRNALYKWGHIGFVTDGHREFADGMASCRLGDVCKFAAGRSLTKAEMRPGNIPVVGGGVKPVGFHDSANTAPMTTIVGRAGSVGVVSRYSSPLYLTENGFKVEWDDDRVDANFGYVVLKHVAEPLMRKMLIGAAQPILNKRAAYALPFPLPPIEAQRAIAAELDQLSASIIELARHAATLRAAIKPSLMRLLHIDAPALENIAAADHHVDDNIDEPDDAPDVDAPDDDAAELLDASE